jgi:hypothetical protein
VSDIVLGAPPRSSEARAGRPRLDVADTACRGAVEAAESITPRMLLPRQDLTVLPALGEAVHQSIERCPRGRALSEESSLPAGPGNDELAADFPPAV